MKRIGIGAAVLICAMVAAAGCGKDRRARARAKVPASLDTPRDALTAMAWTLEALDREPFLRCFAGTEAELALPEALFEFSQAASAFREAMITRHGRKAWEEFQDPKGRGARLDVSFGREGPDAWVKSFSFTEDGDTATARHKESGRVMPLIRENGQWRVKAVGVGPPGFDPKRGAEMMGRCTAVIQEYTQKLEEPGVDLRALDAKMGVELIVATAGPRKA